MKKEEHPSMDENSQKEVEDDIVEITDETK